MFNLGFSEILIVGVLALLLIGPKQLPEVAKILGRMINEFKKASTDLSGGLLEMKEELKKPMREGLGVLADLQDAAIENNPIEKIKALQNELNMSAELEQQIKKITHSAETGHPSDDNLHKDKLNKTQLTNNDDDNKA